MLWTFQVRSPHISVISEYLPQFSKSARAKSMMVLVVVEKELLGCAAWVSRTCRSMFGVVLLVRVSETERCWNWRC